MRARGDASGSVFTDTIADKFGVVKGSYTSIPLPATEVYQASTPCAACVAVVMVVGDACKLPVLPVVGYWTGCW